MRLVSASCSTRTSSTAPGLPAPFQKTGDLIPDLDHPPGDCLLVAAPHERGRQHRLMPRKRTSSRSGGLGPVLGTGT